MKKTRNPPKTKTKTSQTKRTSSRFRGRFPKKQRAQAAAPNGQQPEFAQGQPIAWFAAQPINDSDTLLGERYLCRTAGMFVVAPSGLGKSTLSIQMAILWCCGLVAFGIRPRKALRILIVQSEDDQGDCTEMSRMMNHLGLNPDQQKQVWTHTELVRCNNLVGFRFVLALRERLLKAKAQGAPFDLVIINPYSVYLGDDVKDTAACAQFLNEWLNPILSEFAIAAILIHHTPKTSFQNTDKFKIWDWMYWGAGCAGITNWARAMLVIKPLTDDMKVYRFIAAKRGLRIGADWNNAFDRYFAWSSIAGVLRWEEATTDQIAKATAAARHQKMVDLDKALAAVPILDPELKTAVINKIKTACSLGRDLALAALNELILADKVLETLIPHPNPGKRGSRPFAGVVQAPKSSMP